MWTYLAVDALLVIVWIILFFYRKDLRKQIIISSIAIMPTIIYVYYAEPSYWHPPKFFSLSIGIEDAIGGFCLGGIGGVLYEELSRKRLKKIRETVKIKLLHWLIPLVVLIISFGLFFLFSINIMITLFFALCTGVVLLVMTRHDLTKPALLSGVYFSTLYVLILSTWFYLFPHALSWWNLDVFWGVTLIDVPLGEALFGFLYGAFWGPLYEFLFGYKLIEMKFRKR